MSKAFVRTSFCSKQAQSGTVEIQKDDVTVVTIAEILNFTNAFMVTDNGNGKVTIDFFGLLNLDKVVTSERDASGNKNLMGRAVVIDNNGNIVTV